MYFLYLFYSKFTFVPVTVGLLPALFTRRMPQDNDTEWLSWRHLAVFVWGNVLKAAETYVTLEKVNAQ